MQATDRPPREADSSSRCAGQETRVAGGDKRHKDDWRENNKFPEAVKILKAEVIAISHYLWDRFSGLS